MSLVSVIAPCYNGARYLDRFFNSLLNQSFMDFDIFFVDDGSTDNTREVAESFISKFKEKGIKLNYIYKENGGAASAINVAFKQKLNSKYLFIIDSDDEIPSCGLAERVKFMEKNSDFGACTGYYHFIDNDTKELVKIHKSKGLCANRKSNVKNIIKVKNIVCCGYLFNKEKLFSVLKKKQIFETKQGQNWQLLIPIADKFKIGVIKKVLYNYYIIKSSHSHSIQPNLENQIKRLDGLYEIQTNVLKTLDNGERYKKFVEQFKYNYLIGVAYRLKNKQLMKESFKEYWKVKKFINIRTFAKYMLIMLGIKK